MSKRPHPILPCLQVVFMVCFFIIIGCLYSKDIDNALLGLVSAVLLAASGFLMLYAEKEDY